MGLMRGIAKAFGYDAVVDRAHRRTIASVTQSEDRELTQSQRRKLVAQSRDVRRNFELAAWAVRKHLDFVSSFTFRSTTGNADFDRAVQELVTERSKPRSCDAAGKHSLRKMIRLAEALRTVDGDCGLLKLANGQLQVIEGDRIKDPVGDFGIGTDAGERADWLHGVKTNKAGRALAYSIHRRQRARLVFERIVSARRLYLHGYFDRADQLRGIAPLAASLNRLRDTYENLDHALAKSKVAQIMGLVMKRNTIDEDFADEEACDDEDEPEFQLAPEKGPFTIDMSVGEDAELLHSNQPSSEFQAFMQTVISLALKSLDIPYFFYDESKLNFFGGKVALSNYLISCRDKRSDNIELLDWWTRWQLGMAVARGEIDLADYGLTWPEIDGRWRWIARGIPWWDKQREISGDILSVHAGFEDYGSIVESRTGQQFEDVIDLLKEQQDYIAEKRVAVSGPKELINFADWAARQESGAGSSEE